MQDIEIKDSQKWQFYYYKFEIALNKIGRETSQEIGETKTDDKLTKSAESLI